jgi:hypothetical protein
VPKDIKIAIISTNFEELVIRTIPLIEKFVDHVLVKPKLKRHRPLIRLPSGIALYVHADVSRIG